MKTIEFTTAQHVKIEYEIAPVSYRLAASLIDLFALLIYLYFMSQIIGISMWGTNNVGTLEFWYLFLVRIPWIFYSPIIEFFTRGQSLGKYTMGIRVVSVTGENAGARAYMTRWIFRLVDIWFGFGSLAMLFASTSKQGQRLGDTMANTVVIRKRPSTAYNLSHVLAIRNADSHVPTYPQVIRFTDEDMMLIKRSLRRVEQYPNFETRKLIEDLAKKTAETLHIPFEKNRAVPFLKTILLDYIVLTR